PAYHYEAINVEAQQDNANSLLNWTKRLIALRKQYQAFGRGSLEFLQPSNQRVVAYLRRYQDETILVVANLSRFAQAVELDLRRYGGYTPVEMFGRTDFPVVGERYYPLTLGPNSFFWFALEQRTVPVTVASPSVEAKPQRIPVVAVPALADMWQPNAREAIAAILPGFLTSRRWFPSKDRRLRSLEITEVVPVSDEKLVMLLVRSEFTTGDPDSYLIPIASARGDEAQIVLDEHPDSLIAEVRAHDGSRALLYGATRNNDFWLALLDAFARRKNLRGENGVLVAQRNRQFRRLWGASHPDLEPVLLPSAEVNTSVRFGDRFVMKLIRTIEPGVNPGVEFGQLLTERESQAFPNAAPFAGHLEYQPDNGESCTFGLLHGFVPNEGTAWQLTRTELDLFLQRLPQTKYSTAEFQKSAPTNFYALPFALADPPAIADELIGSYLRLSFTMGQRVAELHRRLARESSDPAFAPEPFNDFYRQSLYHGYVALTGRRLEFLRQRYADMNEDVRVMAAKLLEQENALLAKFRLVFEQRIFSQRTRFHGRLHLGHLLLRDNDFAMFDFEGDPQQHLSERRIKRCPMRDVASMLVSFGYAAQSAMRQTIAEDRTEALSRHTLRVWGRFWYSHVSAAFLRGYFRAAARASYLPASETHREILLHTYLLERALLDIRADIEDKPALSGMPLRVILHLLDAEAERKIGE
ncbi:MAG: alpha-glucosidase C-terminal domain-containing protein, partial [Acidobacteriaceae bacterium]|nr:alpha-glucosidase C-terminal domain-containing protein [Acidobacteriaceae bacterium]